MNDTSNPTSDTVTPLGNEMAPIAPDLQTRRELAEFLDIPYKRLTFVLYTLDRASAYRVIEIPKSSGGTRTLHAVNGPWKGLQRTALDKLQAHWQPTPYAHGFVLGKSILTNAALHSRTKRIMKVDIKDFFPSINFARVQGMFCAPPFNFGKEVAVTLAQLACLDGGSGQLPQGGVLSPYISNMICRRLDRRLATLAREHHCRFTRYADDMTFSTNDLSKFDANALLNSTYQIIESEHFEPNRNKTRILSPRDRQIVTGIVVNKGLNVNRKYLRNVRATIRNCERYGIESQVVKPGAFRDERNSRVGLERMSDGFRLGEANISEDDACRHFVWHLWGKLSFIGSVVEFSGQSARPQTYGRVAAFERLLERFFLLVQRDGRCAVLEHTLIRCIAKHPRVHERLRLKGERKLILDKALMNHRADPSFRDATRGVEVAEDREAIETLVSRLANSDPRFFQFPMHPDLEKTKNNIIEKLNFPPFDRGNVHHVLRSIQNSTDGLGTLTHRHPIKDGVGLYSGARAFEILARDYYPIYYTVPFGLRALFDYYETELKKIVAGKGPEFPIDVVDHEALNDAMKALKVGTRFLPIPMSDDASSFKALVWSTTESVRMARSRSGVHLLDPDVKEISLYTHVESIGLALFELLSSMVKNTNGSEVKVQLELVNEDKIYELLIRDNADDAIHGVPCRSFAHGKIGKAIRVTNGICAYWLEANFSDGGRVVMDMHSGKTLSVDPRVQNGFVHRLRFSRELDAGPL